MFLETCQEDDLPTSEGEKKQEKHTDDPHRSKMEETCQRLVWSTGSARGPGSPGRPGQAASTTARRPRAERASGVVAATEMASICVCRGAWRAKWHLPASKVS